MWRLDSAISSDKETCTKNLCLTEFWCRLSFFHKPSFLAFMVYRCNDTFFDVLINILYNIIGSRCMQGLRAGIDIIPHIISAEQICHLLPCQLSGCLIQFYAIYKKSPCLLMLFPPKIQCCPPFRFLKHGKQRHQKSSLKHDFYHIAFKSKHTVFCTNIHYKYSQFRIEFQLNK